MNERLDPYEEPAWVGRMRAKGHNFRPSTGIPGLPFEPEISFDDPELTRRPSFPERIAGFAGRIVKMLPGLRRRSHDSHAAVP